MCTTCIETLCKQATSVAHLTDFSFELFHETFTEGASLLFLYHGAKKSKITKNSNQRRGGGSCLNSLNKLFCQRDLRFQSMLHSSSVRCLHQQKSKCSQTSDKTNNSLVRTFAGQMVGQAFSLVKKIRLRRTTVTRTFDKTNICSGPSASKVRITQTFSIRTLKTTAILKEKFKLLNFQRLLTLLKVRCKACFFGLWSFLLLFEVFRLH